MTYLRDLTLRDVRVYGKRYHHGLQLLAQLTNLQRLTLVEVSQA